MIRFLDRRRVSSFYDSVMGGFIFTIHTHKLLLLDFMFYNIDIMSLLFVYH